MWFPSRTLTEPVGIVLLTSCPIPGGHGGVPARTGAGRPGVVYGSEHRPAQPSTTYLRGQRPCWAQWGETEDSVQGSPHTTFPAPIRPALTLGQAGCPALLLAWWAEPALPRVARHSDIPPTGRFCLNGPEGTAPNPVLGRVPATGSRLPPRGPHKLICSNTRSRGQGS